jgi:hypothetical protein
MGKYFKLLIYNVFESTENPRVPSSILGPATTKYDSYRLPWAAFFFALPRCLTIPGFGGIRANFHAGEGLVPMNAI